MLSLPSKWTSSTSAVSDIVIICVAILGISQQATAECHLSYLVDHHSAICDSTVLGSGASTACSREHCNPERTSARDLPGRDRAAQQRRTFCRKIGIPFLHNATFHRPKALTIVYGNHRGGELAWRSMLRHLVCRFDTDLAVFKSFHLQSPPDILETFADMDNHDAMLASKRAQHG